MAKVVKNNQKVVFRFVNLEDIQTFVDFLEDNDISYDPDLADDSSPRFVSIGTSKNYTVGTSKKQDIYIKKNVTPIYFVDSLCNSGISVDTVIENCFEDLVENNVEDEISLEDEVTIVPNEIVVALFEKIKSQKKSPKNYFIVGNDNDGFKATTNNSLVNYGNVYDLYTNINS